MKRNNDKKMLVSDASGLRIGIVVAHFNNDITEKLLEGAVAVLRKANLKESKVKVYRVPGGFEIPLACLRLTKQQPSFDAIIAIGCVIRGDTDHYRFVAEGCNNGIMKVMLEQETPIANCVLTVENLDQAWERTEGENNKGREAAFAVLAMAIELNKKAE